MIGFIFYHNLLTNRYCSNELSPYLHHPSHVGQALLLVHTVNISVFSLRLKESAIIIPLSKDGNLEKTNSFGFLSS